MTVKKTDKERHTEDALDKIETHYRELLDLAVDGILLGSHEGLIIEANRHMKTIIGMAKEDMLGQHISALPFTKECLDKSPFRFDLLQKDETLVTERTLIRPDGSEGSVEMRTKMMPDGSYQSIFRDITERKCTEEALRNFTATLETRVEECTREIQSSNISLLETTARLRDLAEEVIQTEERERKRLATILHDDLQQLLVAAKMKTLRLASDADIPLMRL